MGFFKKVGGFIKKTVNLKNVVKLGTPLLGAVPIFGGLAQNVVQNISDNHELQKQQQAQLIAEQQYAEQLANEQAIQQQAMNNAMLVKNVNPSLKDVLTGAAGGLLTGAGTVLAGSTTVGNVGSNALDSTLSIWFKKNWLKLIGGILGTVTLVTVFIKILPKSKPKSNYRRK